MKKIFYKPFLSFRYRLFFTLLINFSFVHSMLATTPQAFGQDLSKVPCSVQLNQQPLHSVFEVIQSQTGYTFLCVDQKGLLDEKVSVKVLKGNLQEVLDNIATITNVEFVAQGKRIIVRAGSANKISQQRTIKGRVTASDDNSPLPGVSILLKGTTTGTVTDENGMFSLNVPEGKNTLVISYIGFTTQEVEINGRSQIDIKLLTNGKSLNEVVVVGYGTQKKSDLTGSIGSVKGSELMERPAINVEQSLAGKIAGVNVSTNSGRPGGRTSISIRGFSSINASNIPLYVVDGIIWTNGITTLNPNDVESIDVLKDASATAIYGTRGSNGVIIVTTKRGKKEHPS